MTISRGDIRPPSLNADEKTTLVAFLDYLREALIAKVSGIGEDDARQPGVESGTSLLWLLKHITATELNWFLWSYWGEGEEQWPGFDPLDELDSVDGLINEYRDAIRRANEVIAECEDLDVAGKRSIRETEPPNMRWVLVHLIEETARHAGHADILREKVDGQTGR